MSTLFHIIYGPASVFVGNPLPVIAIAMVYGIALCILILHNGSHRRGTQILTFVTMLAWVAFARNEHLAQQAQGNIRVDLLFAWPPLLLLSLLTAGLAIRAFRAETPRHQDHTFSDASKTPC